MTYINGHQVGAKLYLLNLQRAEIALVIITLKKVDDKGGLRIREFPRLGRNGMIFLEKLSTLYSTYIQAQAMHFVLFCFLFLQRT